ncbi:MAG: hypothetical protein ACYS9Y_12370 [Planctomycetota bacterium]
MDDSGRVVVCVGGWLPAWSAGVISPVVRHWLLWSLAAGNW